MQQIHRAKQLTKQMQHAAIQFNYPSPIYHINLGDLQGVPAHCYCLQLC